MTPNIKKAIELLDNLVKHYPVLDVYVQEIRRLIVEGDKQEQKPQILVADASNHDPNKMRKNVGQPWGLPGQTKEDNL